jgi:hypothetical protein
MLITVKEETCVTSIFDFINEFKLEKWFKKEYCCNIKDWNFDVSDKEVIDNWCKQQSAKYLINYIDIKDGYFMIYKF